MAYPKSPYDKEGGLVYFPRMLDKIRLNLKGELGQDYLAQLGKGFDWSCCMLLRVEYSQVVEKVASGMSDSDILKWCFTMGRKPEDYDAAVWNSYMIKCGWREENPQITQILERNKMDCGFQDREDILTFFDCIEADEKRKL